MIVSSLIRCLCVIFCIGSFGIIGCLVGMLCWVMSLCIVNLFVL